MDSSFGTLRFDKDLKLGERGEVEITLFAMHEYYSGVDIQGKPIK
jgi:hypothetical protein